MSLAIRLGDHEVGRLELVSGTSRFSLSESYRRSVDRPTLGQIFFDDEARVHLGKGGRLPNWFSQLLPEGALRSMVEARALTRTRRHELYLLDYLGSDLPGAVRVARDDLLWKDDDPPEGATDHDLGTAGGVAISFSLAGVQPKFSVIERTDGGLTLPGKDEHGLLILKVPSPGRPRLAAVELATLDWARASGITVPQAKLRLTSDAHWIPDEMKRASPTALAVSRFDRGPNGTRVHIEDMTQVLDRPPGGDEKYHGISYEQLAAVVSGVANTEQESAVDAKEFVTRLVFMAFSGNEDMHLKNVSLIYPDARRARLAPAYDLVPTRLFTKSDELALKLGGSQHWRDLRRSSFESIAKTLRREAREVLEWVDEAALRIRSAWAERGRDLPFTREERDQLESWWSEVPLLRTT